MAMGKLSAMIRWEVEGVLLMVFFVLLPCLLAEKITSVPLLGADLVTIWDVCREVEGIRVLCDSVT
jgi:hypothetical protein